METSPIRLLAVNEMSRHYGGVIALSDVTMAVHPGPNFQPDRTQWRRKDDTLQLRHWTR